ncbi:unnamed protein product [Discula destructiva]
MKLSTIVTVLGLVGAGAAQGPPPMSGGPPPMSEGPPHSSGYMYTSTLDHMSHHKPSSTAEAHEHKPSSMSVMGHEDNGTYHTITTVVDYFVTVCAEPTTFYVSDECYTATSSNQPVTVTNCPCTVESVCTTPYAAPTGPAPIIVTGYLATSSAAAQKGTTTGAATQYVQATGTKYVTAGVAKPTLGMGLLVSFVTLGVAVLMV